MYTPRTIIVTYVQDSLWRVESFPVDGAGKVVDEKNHRGTHAMTKLGESHQHEKSVKVATKGFELRSEHGKQPLCTHHAL